jgi:hypothetical protein
MTAPSKAVKHVEGQAEEQRHGDSCKPEQREASLSNPNSGAGRATVRSCVRAEAKALARDGDPSHALQATDVKVDGYRMQLP